MNQRSTNQLFQKR